MILKQVRHLCNKVGVADMPFLLMLFNRKGKKSFTK